jgi:opacity protein-like surface antigen
MKKLLMGAALVAVLASPAFAQAYDPDFGSGNIVPGPGGAYVTPDGESVYMHGPRGSSVENGYGAQASAPDASASTPYGSQFMQQYNPEN